MVRKSLEYQGIARRALDNNSTIRTSEVRHFNVIDRAVNIEYETDIDVLSGTDNPEDLAISVANKALEQAGKMVPKKSAK